MSDFAIDVLLMDGQVLLGHVDRLVACTKSLAEYKRGKLSAKKRRELSEIAGLLAEVGAEYDRLLEEPDHNALATEAMRFERARLGL